MPWSLHRWLFLHCISIIALKDCQSFFLMQSDTGRCIKPEGLVYNDPRYSLPYWAVMTDNCLDVKAEFRFDGEYLKNIHTDGTLAWYSTSSYKGRLSVYKGVSRQGIQAQHRADHNLKQTNAGSLRFYNRGECALPSTRYVKRTRTCDTAEQKISFGAVTDFNDTMENINCSSKQRMMVHRADYGYFNNNGVFNIMASINSTCTIITNCQVKSLCGGERSCELTMNNNLLPSHYCPDTSKEIYTEHTCVDNYTASIITGPNVRLSQSPLQGFIEIKDNSTWRKVSEERWDEYRQKMLCQHLGFNGTDGNINVTRNISSGNEIATGDLICYKTQPNGTSCCIHVVPSTTNASTSVPYVTCGKICDKPLILQNITNAVFFGSGGSWDYEQARFYNDGWCATGYGYLLIELQNDYHIIRVVTMGDRNQTKWGSRFTLTYNHNKSIQITGNQNGYQASITTVDIFNVRHIKIESTTRAGFCLRIELCGEVQWPAPVQNITANSSRFSVYLTWTIPKGKVSSYITHFIIYLNGTQSDGKRIVRISREKYGNEFVLRELKPYTEYTVGIQAQDGSLKNATIAFQNFETEEAVPNGPPLNVAVVSRGRDSLGISWKAPDKRLWNGKLIGYQVCYSSVNDENRDCLHTESSTLSYNIRKLQPSTKYFVTVAASTKIGYGNKSLGISKITNGEPVNPVAASYSSLNITLAKQATYIKNVMVIVQIAQKIPTPVEDIETNDLKPFQNNSQYPYVTAYFKADVLPLTFVIGDGKEYNSEDEKYFNQPLKQITSYIVFLRFFETKDSYYSTEWSRIAKTIKKPLGHSGPPLNVTVESRDKNSLEVSWKVPDKHLQNSELTGYQVCLYTMATTPECFVFKSTKVLSLTLNNLQPSTKYFVVVLAITKAGYGEKSLEVSKITSGEPINPVTTSYYTLSLSIPKQEDYIREVMVIVESSIKSSTRSEDLKANDLKPYLEITEGPYVTAYLKADVLPLLFVIGDGNEYNSKHQKYFNQPLKQNSDYIVFLMFFENQSSYYSTEWSDNVKTMMKPSVECVSSRNSSQSNGEEKMRLDLLIPLVILVLCFLLSLSVIIYQRRLIQNNIPQPDHKYEASEQAKQTMKFGSNKMMNIREAAPEDSYMNDEALYELPDSVIECIGGNQTGPRIFTEEESSTYMPLKGNREPRNVYQSLQPPGTSADSSRKQESNTNAMEYENPAFTVSGSPVRLNEACK